MEDQSGDPERRIQTVCLLIISAIGLGAALHWLRPLMIPFVLSLFCAFVLSLLVDLQMRRLHFPRWLAISSSVVISLLFFALFASVVSTSVSELANNANRYQAAVLSALDDSLNRLPLEEWGITSQELDEYFEVPVRAVGAMLLRTTNAILDILSQSTLVLIFVVFLLIGSKKDNRPTGPLWVAIQTKVRRYLLTKTVVSAATGFLVGLILSILDVDLAMAFGLLAFFLNFIPSLGSIMATLLPIPVVLVSPDATTSTIILAIALPGSVQIVVGNIIEPKIMGDSLELHPVALLMALIFWGMLWGIVGMFLAVPITAVLKFVMAKYEHTRPFALILEGRLQWEVPEEQEPQNIIQEEPEKEVGKNTGAMATVS